MKKRIQGWFSSKREKQSANPSDTISETSLESQDLDAVVHHPYDAEERKKNEAEEIEREEKAPKKRVEKLVTFIKIHYIFFITVSIVVGLCLTFLFIVSMIPLTSYKKKLLVMINNEHMEGRIDGMVTFNPFNFSYSIKNAEIKIYGATDKRQRCTPHVKFVLPKVSIRAITGGMTIQGGEIDVITNGDGKNLYQLFSFISSAVGANIDLSIDNTLLSLNVCAREGQGHQKVSMVTDFITTTLTGFNIYGGNGEISLQGKIKTKEGDIDLDYFNHNTYGKWFNLDSDFLKIGFKIDESTDARGKIGEYSFNSIDSKKLLSLLNLLNDGYLTLLKNTQLKTEGELFIDKDNKIYGTSKFYTSYGDGVLDMSFQDKRREINLAFDRLNFTNLPPASPSQYMELGITDLMFRVLQEVNHTFSLKIAHVLTKAGKIDNFELTYGTYRGFLDSSQLKINASLDGGKLSLMMPAVKSNIVSDKKEDLQIKQIVTDKAKALPNASLGLLIKVPLKINGVNLKALVDILNEITPYDIHDWINKDGVQNFTSYDIRGNFFIDSKRELTGFSDLAINLSRLDGAITNISGEIMTAKEEDEGGFSDHMIQCELTATNADLAQILSPTAINSFIKPITSGNKAMIENFFINTKNSYAYDALLHVKNSTLSGFTINSFDVDIKKLTNYFHIDNLIADSSALKGKMGFMFDARGNVAYLKLLADFSFIDTAILNHFIPAPSAPDSAQAVDDSFLSGDNTSNRKSILDKSFNLPILLMVDGSVKVKIDKLLHKDKTLTSLDAAINITNGISKIDKLNFGLNSSSWALSGEIDLRKEPKFEIDFSIMNLEIGDFYSSFFPGPGIAGPVILKGQFMCDGLDLRSALSSGILKAKIESNNLKVKEINLTEISRILRSPVSKYDDNFSIDKTISTGEMQLSEVNGEILLSEAKMYTRDIITKGQGISGLLKFEIDIKEDSIKNFDWDFLALGLKPKALLKDIKSLGDDDYMTIPMAFRAIGSLSKPTYELYKGDLPKYVAKMTEVYEYNQKRKLGTAKAPPSTKTPATTSTATALTPPAVPAPEVPGPAKS